MLFWGNDYVVYWPLSYWFWKETCNMYFHFLSFLDPKELEILPYGGKWWCHQMETFSASLTLCARNSPVTSEFLAQRPVMRSFDVSFDLRLNKRFNKQWWGWWFETPSYPLWRHSERKGLTTRKPIVPFEGIEFDSHAPQRLMYMPYGFGWMPGRPQVKVTSANRIKYSTRVTGRTAWHKLRDKNTFALQWQITSG